ncbi:MAG: 2-isopropylmalate synthase [Pegethrix bostrychoides GSE-TBD4-15B]|jgi:isopropylmalate/homocitrate/citramalate synthase|uniref:2-isopropylmalate synthase n=1 Tax=Pegethrix bostrychoides GSE-TBD4-15B TaxID=2839662 RepID=A0A951U7A9_9CYAN|nr:2-isopropylmalate synthase [Pegethrix bostrychoides GSE-TBD4-15B]
METVQLQISDETLRDGEQQVGVFFEAKTKRHLAQLIAQTGVHQIALMPSIHPTEEHLVKTLIQSGLGHQVVASTLMIQKLIDQAKACGVRQIILFHAVSDRLLFLRDARLRHHPQFRHKTVDDAIPKSVLIQARQDMLETVLQHLQYATQLDLKICFAAEDASRADFDFLVEAIRQFRPYLDQFLLCDTVGCLTPEKTYIWMRDLLESTQQAPLSVHFHNDMGLALENTVQAVRAGATGISGTFGGIGERAGNVALEQVLNGLRLRFGWEVAGIDYDALEKVTDYLHQLQVYATPPYSAQAQRCETGIHVNSILRDRQSYSIFPQAEPEIWFGKCSGASNFQYLFERHLQHPLSRSQYEQLRSTIKILSIQQQRSFSRQEVVEMLERGILTAEAGLGNDQD